MWLVACESTVQSCTQFPSCLQGTKSNYSQTIARYVHMAESPVHNCQISSSVIQSSNLYVNIHMYIVFIFPVQSCICTSSIFIQGIQQNTSITLYTNESPVQNMYYRFLTGKCSKSEVQLLVYITLISSFMLYLRTCPGFIYRMNTCDYVKQLYAFTSHTPYAFTSQA